MDVKSYQEIKVLFQTKWDPMILDIVAEAPCRYSDLARRVRGDVNAGLADNSLGRSLARLMFDNMIRTTEGRGGGGRSRYTYEITAKGRQKLATYRAILETYRRFGTDPAG